MKSAWPVERVLTAPWYLFDAADTMDKVDREALVPISRVDIIESTTGTTAAKMRGALP